MDIAAVRTISYDEFHDGEKVVSTAVMYVDDMFKDRVANLR